MNNKPAPRSSRELVLTALRERGAMSRAELARYAQAAPSTISAVVQDLVADGVVVGSDGPPGAQRGQPGRPGLRLTLNPGAGAVAGIEVGFDFIRVLLCDLAHNIIGSAGCELPDGHTSAAGLPAARRLIEQTLATAGLTPSALIGAGVSLPGPVHNPDAVQPSPILPGWPGVSGHDVEAALGVPVSIDNDANLAALGEHIWGAGQSCDDCITIKFHYGIGCGLFVNGTLVRGTGGAGEIGHTCVDQRGPLCRCGKRGCLDTYAAIPAMLDALRPQHGALTLPGLMTLLAGRDPGAIRVVSDAAELVGQHLAAACNLLAPQRVVLVGAMAEAGDLVLGPIRAALHRNIAPNQPPDLVLGTLGTRHTALGAVALALGESDWLPAAGRRALGEPPQPRLAGRRGPG